MSKIQVLLNAKLWTLGFLMSTAEAYPAQVVFLFLIRYKFHKNSCVLEFFLYSFFNIFCCWVFFKVGLEFHLTKQIVEIHPPQSIIVFSPLQLHAKTMQISMFVSSQRMRWSNRVGTRNCFWSITFINFLKIWSTDTNTLGWKSQIMWLLITE